MLTDVTLLSPDSDECQGSPCVNAVSCKNLVGDYQCECMDGWTGKNCDQTISNCGEQCHNGGTCIDLAKDYRCICQSGYTGQYLRRGCGRALLSPLRCAAPCRPRPHHVPSGRRSAHDRQEGPKWASVARFHAAGGRAACAGYLSAPAAASRRFAEGRSLPPPPPRAAVEVAGCAPTAAAGDAASAEVRGPPPPRGAGPRARHA